MVEMGSTRAPACGLRRLVANVGEGKMFDARARRTAREARALPFELIPESALSRRNRMKAEMGTGIIAGRMSRLQLLQTAEAGVLLVAVRKDSCHY